MAKINGNEIKPGNVIEHQGGVWRAMKTNSVKPGKGGAFNQVELRNLINGSKLNERFRASETVEKVRLEQKDYQFLFGDDDSFTFMDTESFEQIELQRDFVGDNGAYLSDGMMVRIEFYEETPLGVAVPEQVILEVLETEPVVKGQTSANSFKPAQCTGDLRIMVPPFVNVGEKIVVQTSDSTYLKRSDYGSRMSRPSPIGTVMIKAARAAGGSLSRDFAEVEHLQVSRKGPADFVTNADLKAEEIIYEQLTKARPGYGFVMEERGIVEGTDKTNKFIVDPLDGTLNFMHGQPHYAVSIGLERDGELLTGVIYDVAKNEIFWAETGRGCWLENRKLRVASRTRLSEAVVATGTPWLGQSEEVHARAWREMAALGPRTAGLRRYGSASLDLAYVAAGRFDGFWERGLKAWGIAAGIVLVREAGGMVTGLDGEDMLGSGNILAGNEALHPKIETALQAALKPA